MNRDIFESRAVVEYYDSLHGLEPCEELIFGKYLKPGMELLDLGVGAGRTTRRLERGALRYVGADLSRAMIERCRIKFPGLDFRVLDAARLDVFSPGEFDAVVFSFNGLDYLEDDDSRRRCLAECARVLRPGGLFIFSAHNARSLLVRPLWRGAGPAQAAWRTIRALGLSFYGLRRLALPAFWRGAGYFHDPTHGGLRTRCATPRAVRGEVEARGFQLVEIVPSEHPRRGLLLATPWYYYIFKRGAKL